MLGSNKLLPRNYGGDVGGSAKKMGMRIRELERLYGIREGSANEKGNNRIGEPNKSVDQSDLASQLGMSVDSLQNYKLLSDMIPELSDLVDTGIVTKTTAFTIMKRQNIYKLLLGICR
jgi:hypothetical protein